MWLLLAGTCYFASWPRENSVKDKQIQTDISVVEGIRCPIMHSSQDASWDMWNVASHGRHMRELSKRLRDVERHVSGRRYQISHNALQSRCIMGHDMCKWSNDLMWFLLAGICYFASWLWESSVKDQQM